MCTLLYISFINSSTSNFSHSNHSLLHTKFHHWFSFQNPTSPNVASFKTELAKSLENLSLRGKSFVHTSSQNFTLFLDPIFHVKLLSNQLSHYPLLHSFLISLFYHESCVSSFVSFRVLQDSYFDIISLERPGSSFISLHFHLLRKEKLRYLISFKPSQLSSLGLQIVSHFTHTIFLPSKPHPYRKFLFILIITFNTLRNILKIGMKYKEITYITYLSDPSDK